MSGLLHSTWRKALRRYHGGPLVVGLVNNMPDAALRSTERQFRELLADAAGRRAVRLRVFSLPGLARSQAGRDYIRDNHEDIERLWDAELDGLIVTGTEPRAADLTAEPFWPALTRLVDWAAEHTAATVWSCLAAHAAVHYLDGIARQARNAKLSGVYDCIQAADHALLGRGPARWRTPHSRCNELPESALLAHGYQILSRADGAGVDIFAKRERSLFLFLQGHPEYDAGALLREYRRDVGRFLAGERDSYPDMPYGYFDDTVAQAMLAFRERALRVRDAVLLADFPTAATQHTPHAPWHGAARRLFANWLSYLADARSRERGWGTSLPSRRAVPKAALTYG